MKRTSEPDARIELGSGLAASGMVREIEAAISAGALKPGDRIASEAQLKEKYGISVGSVRRGMDLLVKRGVISRRRGSGSYVQAPPPPPPALKHVVADTVLIAVQVLHVPTHPYFGERERALKNRLNAFGWKVEFFANGQTEADLDYTDWRKVDMPRLIRRLDEDRRIAGVIVDRFTVEAVVAAVGSRLPCLCLSATTLCPFVDYRWEDEYTKAVRLVVEAGARRIWIVGDEVLAMDPLLKRLGVRRGSLELLSTPIKLWPASTGTAYDAYEATRQTMRENGQKIDGIVMVSEFHAQGVLDALGTMRAEKVRPLRLVAMINKESHINTALPYTATVADGAAIGAAQADLLHQHITMPDHAREFVYMSTTVWAAKGWPRPRECAVGQKLLTI